MIIKKIWRKTTKLQRSLDKLEKKWIYSHVDFEKDIVSFLEDECNNRFRKHSIDVKWWKVWSITLWYDLRTLYFLEKKVLDVVEYIFFDIWTHDDIY